MGLSKTLATEYVRRFPNAATKTIACKLFKDNSRVYPNLEAARSAVRAVRGAQGKKSGHKPVPGLEREPQKPGDPFGKLPEPWEEMPNWKAVQFDGPLSCLVLSDIHIPFYDRRALEAAVRYGLKQNVDMVLLNGDAWDCFWGSDFVKDPRLRNFRSERQAGKQLLDFLRSAFKKARIIYKIGNHEERAIRYFMVKAPEIFGEPEFEVQSLLDFKSYGIEHVGEMRPIRLGSLNVIHGHEYKFPITNPVNPARGLFNRAKAHALCAHHHQTSQHSENTLEDLFIATWSTGCLCGLHPTYRPLNNWNHGFAKVEVDKNNAFQVKNPRIIGGEVYE